MLRDFLALLDDLERAMTTEPPAGIDKDAFAGYKEGVQRVFEGGINTLKHYGVVRFDSRGEIFDPERHEAMRRESHRDYDVNHVCAVFQTGYLVGDRLLRAARVSVSSGPSTTCIRCHPDESSISYVSTFGFRSVIPSQVPQSLLEAENALGTQSLRHPDGARGSRTM